METGATHSLEQNDAKEEAMEKGQHVSEKATRKFKQLSFQQVNRNAGEDALMAGGGGAACPFHFFPEEVWSKIIDQLVDSKDIQNVLWGYPDLDQAFQNKKASWLFGLVLPHLMTNHLVQNTRTRPHLRELLKLRLVSKRWKDVVDKSLESHAGRHPLLPKGNFVHPGSSVVAIPETHFNYHSTWDGRPGASTFEGAPKIKKFLREMGDYQGNPFPGKSILLEIEFGYEREDVTSLVTLLERFGEHVFDLEINCNENHYNRGDVELCQSILKCLTLVPNLRSLFFTGHLFRRFDEESYTYFSGMESQDLFPELMNLRRFEWRDNSNVHSSWIDRLIRTYGRKDGLLKLSIPFRRFWEMSWAFRCSHAIHVTELEILLEDKDGSVQRIKNLVKMLPNNSEIRKLSLSCCKELCELDGNQLIGMFAECQFESVVFQDIRFMEMERSIGEAVILVRSITSVVVKLEWERRIKFDFLRFLPNLKFLRVYLRHFNRLEALKEVNRRKYCEEGEWRYSLRKTLIRYFLTALDPEAVKIPETVCIWKEFPKLELLSVDIMTVAKYGMNRIGVHRIGVKFAREYGNKVFFGPRRDVVQDEVD